MTADDLADLVVVELNAIANPPIKFTAVKPDDFGTIDKETSSFTVFVIPFSESEEAFDRGDACREELVVSVVVNGPVKAPLTRAEASEFVRLLRSTLRETILDEVRWSSNETVSLYDFEAMKTKKQFLSLFQATYYRFG